MVDYRKKVIDGIKELKEYNDYKEIVKYILEIENKNIGETEFEKYFKEFYQKFPEEMVAIETINSTIRLMSNNSYCSSRFNLSNSDILLNYLIRIFLIKISKKQNKNLNGINLDDSIVVYNIYNEYKNIIDRKKKIKVVAALIEKDNKYLIAKRATGDVNMLSRWEFPGGKVELDEDELSAIEREIKEEFELEVKASNFIINSINDYSDKIVDLRLYSCKYVSGEFKLHDHSEYRFVDKDDLLKYDLCPADMPLAEYVKEMM